MKMTGRNGYILACAPWVQIRNLQLSRLLLTLNRTTNRIRQEDRIFLLHGNAVMPTSSTSSLLFHIPTCHPDYSSFKENVDYVLKMA